MALDDYKINLNEVNLVSQLDNQPQLEPSVLKGTFDQAGQNIKTKYNNLIDELKNLLPTGLITPFGGDTAPSGWLICDGSAVSRTTYASLFEAIGTTYGGGDGETTFNLPNFKGKVIVGLDSSQTEFNSLGKTGGEKTHTLTIPEMPSHTHGLWTRDAYGGGTSGGTIHWEASSSRAITTQSTGGGGAHNNLQPYAVVNYIIKA